MIAILSWWLVIQLFTLAALPLAWRLFARLPGRGYPFAKALGLLLVSFILWLGAIFHLLPNDVGGIVVALAVVAALSAWLGREGLRRDGSNASARPLIAWLRGHWRLVLTTEVLFLVVFVGWTAFRAYNPDIAGTEKPMEFAFINGVLGSRFFPPQDPWLSGYAISYYYFGYVMLGVLIRLSGVAPAIGFNLGVASWFALVMIGAFGIVYDLVRLAGNWKPEGGNWKLEAGNRKLEAGADENATRNTQYAIRNTDGEGRGIGFGLLGALFVGFLGNLEVLAEFAYNRGLVPLSWLKWLDIKQLMDAAPTGNWTGGFWWWWRASRVVHDKDLLGNTIEVIDEFPFFSFLLGDMHPHVLALPFVLLAVGLALNLLLGARDWVLGIGYWKLDARGAKPQGERSGTGIIPNTQYLISSFWSALGSATGLGTSGIILYAVAFGALGFLNTWDFPIYVALAALTFGVGLALSNGLNWAVIGRSAAAGLVFLVLGWLLYLPFYIGFQSQLGGILPNLLFPTRLSQYFVMFGPFLVVAIFFLLLVSRGAGERGGRGAGENGRKTLALLPWTLLLPLAFIALIFAGLLILPQGKAFLDTVMDNPAVKANIGGRAPAQLIALIARVRLATPWTYLFLAGLIAWAGGVLWTRLASSDKVTGRQGDKVSDGSHRVTVSPCHPVTDHFVLLLIGLALLLTLVVEFVYLRDLFGSRMNTVFKFYYQAWVMLGIAAAYGLSRLAERGTALWLKLPALLLTGVLVLGGLCYPLAAILSKADNFKGQATLDGLMYLRRSNPADVAAIEWLAANVPPTAVVLEATGGSYSPEGAERVSMSTGNSTLLGWDFHERQWRGNAGYDKLATGRPEAIDKIYRSARPEELPGLLVQWGVDYVYIGALERQKYGVSDATLARFDRALRKVYDKDGVRVYAR
ncbi:MAG: DUF2298 domain-containing protein [Chloroflexi bacterium]|nr:DUF2298 domain-containing protein [Chloroflexota bacterium]